MTKQTKKAHGTAAAMVLSGGIRGWRPEPPRCPCGCGAVGRPARGSSYGFVFDCDEANA